jgi:N-acetylglucosamine-6-phosphate deacetylase
MTRTAICGASLITPQGVLENHALVMEDGRIAAVLPTSELPQGARREVLPGGFLAPGFIDVQVNGGGGVLLNDHPTVEGMEAIAAAHRGFGTTGLMPTLISDDLKVVETAINAADAAVAVGVPGVLGLHIEGPFLNADKRGIHNAGKFRVLNDEALALLMRKGPAQKMLTLAPELAPAGAIKTLTDAGVIVCAGHSLATYDEAVAALRNGLAGFTHLFNAMTQLGSREPGMVGAALDDRQSRFGLIVDGVHVHPAALRIALAARGPEGAMLVTDAMPTVGSASKTFMLGDQLITAVGSACRAADGTLAGSNLDMATAYANAIRLLGATPFTASQMASENPAAFLRMNRERGALVPGLRADLVHLNDQFDLTRVWIAGEPTTSTP